MPEDIRSEIEQIVQDMEKDVWDKYGEMVKKEEKEIQENGMEIISLPPAEAEEFLKIAREEGWKEVFEADPERAQQIYDLMYEE